MVRRILRKLLFKVGLSISRIYPNDTDLYQKRYNEQDIIQKKFYNIGAGLFKHPAWTNVDHYSSWYKGNEVHIDYDLLKCHPLPIEDESANVVYSSHTIEHISDEAAQNMFNESFRVLKKGGFLRITTPDIDLHFRTVLNEDYDFWKWRIENYSRKDEMQRIGIKIPFNKVSIKQLFLFYFFAQTSIMHVEESFNKISDAEFDEIFSKMKYVDALDYIKSKCDLNIHVKYSGNHINWWNKEKLTSKLQSAGFRNVYSSGYGQSNCSVLRNVVYFDNTSPEISLYVEAQKDM